jgi:peptide deformylase
MPLSQVNVQAGYNQVVMMVLLVNEPSGQFAGVVVVDKSDNGHLFAPGMFGLLFDEPVADQVADSLAARRVALGRQKAVEGFQERRFQGNADACQIGHGSLLGGDATPYDKHMKLKIAQLGQPILRTVAAEVWPEEIATPEFQRFLDDLLETLRDAKGAGLAGPQVFVAKRVFLAAVLPPLSEDGQPEMELFVNPRLVSVSPEGSVAWEGCLSFAELLVLVPRHERIRVEYLDRYGQPRALDLEDFPARVVQHEYDHLDGILTLDRALSSRDIIKASEIEAVLDREQGTGNRE